MRQLLGVPLWAGGHRLEPKPIRLICRRSAAACFRPWWPVVGEIGNDVFGQLFANVSRPTVRVAALAAHPPCACCTASCPNTSLAQHLALKDTRSRCIAQWNYMPDNDAAHLLDVGDEPARILELISPTGFEEF